MSAEPGQPLRVVFFGGPYLQPGAQRFVDALAVNPEIELLAGYCQGDGTGLRHRLGNLWRRRGLLALAVLAREAADTTREHLRAPAQHRAFRRRMRRWRTQIRTVPDVHATDILREVAALAPDLGVIYGAPILRPELFGIPAHGTLGIHHGAAPRYRGKKTTFWEMYNGERTAGVVIQRVGPGIDTGDIVRAGAVEIGCKSYRQVEAEVETLGLELFLAAILDIKRGRASFRPQERPPPGAVRCRQPTPRELLTFWLRRRTHRASHGATT